MKSKRKRKAQYKAAGKAIKYAKDISKNKYFVVGANKKKTDVQNKTR